MHIFLMACGWTVIQYIVCRKAIKVYLTCYTCSHSHTIEGIKVNAHVYKLIITMLLQLQGERGTEYITQCACTLLVHYNICIYW